MGYLPFELVNLHKPTDRVDVRFDPFKGKLQNVLEYITMMLRRFNVIRE